MARPVVVCQAALGRDRAARDVVVICGVFVLLDSRRLPRFGSSMSGRGAPRPGWGRCARRGAPRVSGFSVLEPRQRRGDVRPLRVWKSLLGLHRVVIEEVELEPGGVVVVSVRPRARERDRCPHCRRRCPGYDQGEGRRRWRALDLGTTFCFLEAWAPRVRCRRHGVVVAAVPWARHDAGFTRTFEDQVVRHEALLNRVGCRSPPPGCRSSSVKRGAA